MLYQVIRKFLFCLLLVGGMAQAGNAAMPNLPSTATVLLDCPFNSVGNPMCGGLVVNSYNAGSIASDSTAPESPNNVYEYFRSGGSTTGGTQLDFFYSQSAEIYVGLAIKTSPGFYGYTSSSNKMTMIGNNLNNFTLGLYGPQGGPHQLFFNDQNAGQINNCHYASNFVGGGAQANGPTVYGDCPGGLNYFGNTGQSATWTHGVWHYAEWCGKASTSTTSRDGIYKWFLDGKMVGNYSTTNTAAYWDANYITPAWDGQGLPWGTDAYWRVDRWVTARLPAGTCASMTGNGSVTPPPADTIAPTQVTGVSISNITATSVRLAWNAATDNNAVVGYNIEMATGLGSTIYSAKQSTSGSDLFAVVTGLSPATSYSFRIKARDSAGNVSAQYSNPVSITTSSPGTGAFTRNTLATDNFNRADTTDLGNGWDGDYYVTGATAPLQIVSNKVRAGVASTTESNETYNAVALPSDQWAQITLSTWAADANERYAWVNVRAGAPQVPSYYQCKAVRNNASGYTVIIERENGNGVYTNLATGSGVVWAAGDTLTCEAIGLSPTIINLYHNGTLALSASDNDALTGLRTGAGIWTTSLAAVELDDFLSGDFTGVALPRITSVITDSTGANITWTGGPASIRINYDSGQVVVAVGSLPGGRFSFIWPADTTFACFFAVDAQGNVNTITEDYVCDTVVPSTVDATPPTVSSPLPSGALAADTTSTTISVVTSEPAVCKYATSAGVSYASMPNSMPALLSNIQHSAVITGLTNNTTYNYYVKCQDTVGNTTPADTNITFSVNAAATDVIAPTVPTNVLGDVLNVNQIRLSFTPSTDAVGVAGYEVFACVTLFCGSSELVAIGGGSPIHVNGLIPNTSYTFTIRAFDAVRNYSVFSSALVLVTPELDTLLPGKMTGLVATRTGYDSFNLSWDPGIDDNRVAAAAIEICVGDGCSVFKLQYIVTGRTSILLTGLASQLPYYFRGKHIDSAGNVSKEYSELAKGEPFPLQSGTVQGVCACQIP